MGTTNVEAPGAVRRLPSGFRVGISDSGYQSEGGFNGPGEPTNSWAHWERSGRAVPAGAANELWDRYPEHLDAAVEAGCDTYRTSVEWARCEPHPGVLDHDAIRHYARILRACHERGIEPVLALQHFTYPDWLGPDLWLDASAPERFARWARIVVEELGEHCSRWVTINEINAAAIGSYLIGYFPPGGRLRRTAMLRATDHMLAAHVRAYDVLHQVQPEAVVGTNTYAFWAYDTDRILSDVLLSRSHGVERHDLREWLAARRDAFHDAVLSDVPSQVRWWDRTVHRSLQAYLRIDQALPAAIEAVHASANERCMDVAQVSWYDPRLATYPRWPGRRSLGRRRWGVDPAHWEQTPSPQHLTRYLQAIAEPSQEIWILENGLCNAIIDGVAHQRPDGWDRPRYIAAHLDAVLDAIELGVDVTAYHHWGLFDSYQWGDYEACFGLRGVDREHGCKLLELDSMGRDSVAALRTLVDARRPTPPPP